MVRVCNSAELATGGLAMRVPAFTLEEYQCSGEHQDDCSNLRTIERAVQQLAAAFGVAPQLGDVDSHASSHQAHSRQVAGLRDRRLPDKQKDGEGKKSKRRDRKSTRLNSSHANISYA